MRLQWIRHTPAQSRVGHLGKLAERQYHAALSLHHDIETTGEPDDENQAKQQPDAATDLSDARWLTAGATTSTSTPTEDPVQFLIEIAPHFVQVRRTIAAAALIIGSALQSASAASTKIEATSYMMHMKEIGPAVGIGGDKPLVKSGIGDVLRGV